MSKRAEDEANKAFPGAMVTVCARGNKFQAGPILRHGFIRGYEQAEKDTLERAIEWWRPRLQVMTRTGLTEGIIEEFRNGMK